MGSCGAVGLDFALLERLSSPPALFAPGDIRFWQDPRVQPQLLATHLDPTVDLASRRPETIAATVGWIVERLDLREGCRVLDLGCGPGLYCAEMARRGLRVTGVDFSQSSIQYAREQAEAAGLRIDYVLGDYVEVDFGGGYDAVLLIFGDLCTLTDSQRERLLARVRGALAPAGRFVFDVSTPRLRAAAGSKDGWEAYSGPGFWRDGPHLVLRSTFGYPEHSVTLEQYVVIDASGEMCTYRIWTHDYDETGLRGMLGRAGLEVEGMYGDLIGAPVPGEPLWLGVVAKVNE